MAFFLNFYIMAVKKYRVNRKFVGVRLMGTEPIVIHNGLSQKKLKELYDFGFTNAIYIDECPK